MTRDDIFQMIEEEDVEFIRLQFTDIFGNLKNIAVTTNQLEKVLDGRCVFDGSAIEGFARIAETDMYLVPDLDTMTIFPWRPQRGKVARLICDVYRADGDPFEGDPRYVLKKEIAKAAAAGYRFDVGPECEFFLFHTDDDGMPTTCTHEKAGYFDTTPLDLGENARRDMILTLEEMGFEIESSHHEISPAQHEIDFHYGEALNVADNIMTFKLTVKTIAKRHGLHATFMPKPTNGINGSGMHTNMSLSINGRNIFYDRDGNERLSMNAYYFIGGIMKHISAITAIANPVVNSYKRLVPGFDAPVYITWAPNKRTSMIRIPIVRGEETRIELTSPDPAANPYLLIAVLLAAGLEGIQKEILPPEAEEENPRKLTKEQRQKQGIKRLPSSLLEAIEALEKDELVKSVLGDYIVNHYVKAKRQEWETYAAQVSNWEVDEYLYRL